MPVVAGVLVLLMLGVVPPSQLADLLNSGAGELVAGATVTTAVEMTVVDLAPEQWRQQIATRVAGGDRFAGVYASHNADAARLHALLVGASEVSCLRTTLTPAVDGSMSLSGVDARSAGGVLVRAGVT